jgi:DNA-binding transcriptional ArsR family regulator
VAATLAALGNRHRVRIVQILLTGDATTGELANSLGEGTTGQLFHHLKDLSAAGLIHQPRRGFYSIRQPDVVPLLTVLAVGADLSAHPGHDPVAD